MPRAPCLHSSRSMQKKASANPTGAAEVLQRKPHLPQRKQHKVETGQATYWQKYSNGQCHGLVNAKTKVFRFAHTYIHICVYTNVHIHMHVCIICKYVYMNMYIHIYTYFLLHRFPYMYAHLYTHMYVYVHIYNMCRHTYVHPYTYMHIPGKS